MSREPTIVCTACDSPTDHYWQGGLIPQHMICDLCFIDLNKQVDKLADTTKEDELIFLRTFTDWRESELEYHKATPQSMLEQLRYLMEEAE